ncbi:MAG: hypothetical protein H0W70_03540 [Actinobacteria bacterium]|nr:hypothetical protein [Actinomycetota bacterium]
MDDRPRYPNSADDPDNAPTGGRSRSSKIVIVTLIVLLVVFVGLHLAGVRPGH